MKRHKSTREVFSVSYDLCPSLCLTLPHVPAVPLWSWCLLMYPDCVACEGQGVGCMSLPRCGTCKKETSVPIIPEFIMELDWMWCGMLLKLVGLINLLFILSCLIEWENLTGHFGIKKKKTQNKSKQKTPPNLNVALHLDIYRLTSHKLCMLDTFKLYSLMLLWMTFKLHSLMPVWITLTFI